VPSLFIKKREEEENGNATSKVAAARFFACDHVKCITHQNRHHRLTSERRGEGGGATAATAPHRTATHTASLSLPAARR
jgi:hypothetical protein